MSSPIFANGGKRTVAFGFLTLISISHLATSTMATGTIAEHAITTPQAEHRVYKWTMNNFTLISKDGKCVTSPKFHTSNKNLHVSLKFCQPVWNDYNELSDYGQVSVETYNLEDKNTIYKMSGQIAILKSGNEIVKFAVNSETVGFGHKIYSQKARLASESFKSLTSDITITLLCDIDLAFSSTELINVTKIEEQKKSEDSEKDQLKIDFGLLLKDDKLSDIDIIVGNETLSAHKVILATRSPVFAAAITETAQNASEKLELKIENMEPGVMRAMLEYIYTGNIVNLTDLALAHKLVIAADTFKLAHLKAICGELLKKEISADKVADILVLSDRYDIDTLKKDAMEFIAANFSVVMETEGYKKMKEKSPALLMEILFSSGKRF